MLIRWKTSARLVSEHRVPHCGQGRIMAPTKLVCAASKAVYKLQPDLKFKQVKKASLNGKWDLYITNVLFSL